MNKVVSTFPLIKPFLIRKELSLSYDALRACFKPYRAFESLKTWWGRSSLSKPGGCLTKFFLHSFNPALILKSFVNTLWLNLRNQSKVGFSSEWTSSSDSLRKFTTNLVLRDSFQVSNTSISPIDRWTLSLFGL